MGTEADTCRTLITPKLQAAGWEHDPHSIAEQRYFTDDRIIVRGNKAERRKDIRRQRADRMKKQQAAFFGYFAPEACEILNDLLEKYASDGELQFTLPDVLKVRPISDHGNVNEIIGKFGGADQLRNAVNQLQSPLYAA
jgi:hypothetical protein